MTKPPKNNLNSRQRKALKELKSDNQNVIYPFDKGAGLVRIDRDDAIAKIEEQLGNTEIITQDPTSTLARKFQNTLRPLHQAGKFTDKEYKKLYPSDPIPPRMYGTIKAHKPEKNYPMRVVVSTIGTPSYGTSEYLVKIIQPTLNKNNTRLKNSYTFAELTRSWDVDPDEIQVSYDVVNLYPTVPVEEATNIIVQMLENDHDLPNRTKLTVEDIRTLIELWLSKCYFLWNDKLYRLQNSAPIGLALMVVMVEAFLQYHEQNALQAANAHDPPVAPKSFVRYVDDSHARFQTVHQAEKFQEILNQQNEHTQYTMETEDTAKSLNFLDVNVRNNNGRYELKIHRKNAITNVQVKPNSAHDPKVLKSIFSGFLNRAYRICDDRFRQEEIDFLINNFVENGYDRNTLTRIANDYDRTRNQTTDNRNDPEQLPIVKLPWIPGLSPKLRKSFRNAGYRTVFKSGSNLKTNGKRYVGETGLKISTRVSQHKKNVEDEKWDISGITNHAKDCTQGLNWNEARLLKTEENKFDRKVREALEIQFRQTAPHSDHGLNLDDGQYVTSRFWKPMLSHIREKTLH
ncbi:uncharacterized protein [Clytia hemisphaerica]